MNEEIIQSSQGRLGSESLSCWFGMVSPSLRHSAGASWTLRQDMLYGWKPRRPFPDPVLSGPKRKRRKGQNFTYSEQWLKNKTGCLHEKS